MAFDGTTDRDLAMHHLRAIYVVTGEPVRASALARQLHRAQPGARWTSQRAAAVLCDLVATGDVVRMERPVPDHWSRQVMVYRPARRMA